MASLMLNRSLCPGHRSFNKQIGTTQHKVYEGLERDQWSDYPSGCMSWLAVGHKLRAAG
jgi:hypothetical protein